MSDFGKDLLESARRADTRREVLSDVDPVVLEAWRLQGRKVGAMTAEAQAAVIELQEECGDLRERVQTLAGLLKRCARCLPADHKTRKLATDYLRQHGHLSPLRTPGVKGRELPGLQTLANVIECLRADARYVDEEGEATNGLQDLLDALRADGAGCTDGR